MSDQRERGRGNRNSQGRGRGSNRGHSRGRGQSNRGGRGGQGYQKSTQPSEPVIDWEKYMNQEIRIKFSGGREGNLISRNSSLTLVLLVKGTLKGYDSLLNLVLDNVTEFISKPGKYLTF